MRYYLTGKQARDIDRYTSETIGTPGIVLMERAALELANVISQVVEKGTILCVVGTGNNGGDAVAAARILKSRGRNAYVYEVNPLGKKTDSFLLQEKIAKNLGVEFVETLPESASGDDLASLFEKFDVIVDGIFGVGLTRDIGGMCKNAVEGINIASEKGAFRSVVACDIPSGIDADTGRVMGCAVKCDITVTFGYTKIGMLINDGRYCSGKIICKEIGLYTPATMEEARGLFDVAAAFEFDAHDLKYRLPANVPDANKGTNGKVLILAGSREVFGAMYLCTSACCSVGAGLVKVVTHERNRDLLMDKLPEVMTLTYGDAAGCEGADAAGPCADGCEGAKAAGHCAVGCEDANAAGPRAVGCEDADAAGPCADFLRKLSESVAWADTVLIGPGLGTNEEARGLLTCALGALKEGQRLVLDADALNILSDMSSRTAGDDRTAPGETASGMFKDITSRLGAGNIVLTPHIGEAVRLVKGLGREMTAAQIKMQPIEAAQWISNATGAVCVLKDARTVVADPADDGVIYINTTGNCGMSKGGSGDVLAGIMAGLLVRTRGSGVTAFETACIAVNLHGRAGDRAKERLGETGMMAGNLIDELKYGRIDEQR